MPITPCLWFDGAAEEAAHFYTSIFKNSKITEVSRYGEGGPMPAGTALMVAFELDGTPFTALNGGPQYTFSEGISLQAPCETQDEIDELWERLTADGGEESQCGWLKDKYGVSWQVFPSVIGELLSGSDPERSGRAMQAMMPMKKIDLAAMQAAYDGR